MESDTGLKHTGQSLQLSHTPPEDATEAASLKVKQRGQYAESISVDVEGGMTSDRPVVRWRDAVAW